MNTPFFSFFLLITLGFSIFSVVGTSSATWNTSDNTQFTITLSEDLVLLSGFNQNAGNNHSVMLNEWLEVLNHDRYQNMITASKHITDTKAIMERILPSTRLRLTNNDDLTEYGKTVTISDFIETITDTFYQGGAKTPSQPMISLAIATSGTEISLQTLQLSDTLHNEIEPFFDDSTSWSEPIQYVKNQVYFKPSLVNSLNILQSSSLYYPNVQLLTNNVSAQLDEFSSNLLEIKSPKLDSTEIILVVTSPPSPTPIDDGDRPSDDSPPLPASWAGSPDPLAAAQAAGYSLAGQTQQAVEEGLTWTIADPTFSGSVLGQDISFSDQKVFEQTSTLGMSSMIDQGKSLESYAESIGVKLPKTDAPAPILGMSSMIDQGKSLESYAESIGVKLPKTDAPAPILSMSSMIDQGKSLESYAESIGVKLPKTDAAPTLL